MINVRHFISSVSFYMSIDRTLRNGYRRVGKRLATGKSYLEWAAGYAFTSKGVFKGYARRNVNYILLSGIFARS